MHDQAHADRGNQQIDSPPIGPHCADHAILHLDRAYGAWAETVTATAEFAPALERAMRERGVKLLHLKTDVEQITSATTITRIRERARR